MLNKELLLSSPQEDEWHFEITVGKNPDFSGWILSFLGSIDRIPYLETEDITPEEIGYDVFNDNTVFKNNRTGSQGEPFTYFLSSEGGQGMTIYYDVISRKVYGNAESDIFGFSEKVGQKIKFRIDPPPRRLPRSRYSGTYQLRPVVILRSSLGEVL